MSIKINNGILFFSFLLIIMIFTLLSLQRYFFNENYLIFMETTCDPLSEKCFISRCDPAAEKCSGGETQDINYFKKVQRLANRIPLCNSEDNSCEATLCSLNETDCVQTFCEITNESECSNL